MAESSVGNAWKALKGAFCGEFSDRLFPVRYDFVPNTLRAMELIYCFIGEPNFEHDFNNVDCLEGEFDQQLCVKDLHTVKKKVGFKTRRSILPPDLFVKHKEMDFWQTA